MVKQENGDKPRPAHKPKAPQQYVYPVPASAVGAASGPITAAAAGGTNGAGQTAAERAAHKQQNRKVRAKPGECVLYLLIFACVFCVLLPSRDDARFGHNRYVLRSCCIRLLLP